MDDKIQATARRLVTMLVAHDFAALEAWCNSTRLRREDMAQAVREYPGRLVVPPGPRMLDLDVIEVTGSQPTRWSVYIPLWTEEEGRSDLALEVTMIDSATELMDVEIDDIHVL